MNDVIAERRIVLDWIRQEQLKYANDKFGFTAGGPVDDHDESMRKHGFSSKDPEAFWFRQVTQYFTRAEIFGVDTPKGQQALLKGLVTLFDCCACMVRIYGLPPAPGHTSGEIEEWVRG